MLWDPNSISGCYNNILASPSFADRLASCCELEASHFAGVLALGKEFREDVVLAGIEEEFWKALTKRGCDNEFGRRDAGPHGAQPGTEGGPDEPGMSDGQVLQQSLADEAGLNEHMISKQLAFDVVAVFR